MTQDMERGGTLDAARGTGMSMLDQMWQELVEKDDRTSPAEYPDMALITRDELQDFLFRWADKQRDHALGVSDV